MFLQDLFESIQQTIYMDAWETLTKSVKEWADNVGMPKLKAKLPMSKLEKFNDENDPEGEKRNNFLSDIRDDAEYLLSSYRDDFDEELMDELIASVKHTMEISLQDFARNYIEEKLGKIEPFDPDEYDKSRDFEKQTAKRHYQLQHIIVQLQTDGKYKTNNTPKTSGGYFQKNLGKGDLNTEYEKNNFNVQNKGRELGVGINIYTSKDNLQQFVRDYLLDKFEEFYFGESLGERDNPNKKYFKSILSTFTHEVIHLEQDTRKYMNKNQSYTTGITYTPNVKNRLAQAKKTNSGKGSDKLNPNNASYRHYKAGKRGKPDHLGDDNYDSASFIDYLGTAHEIEAHAAGAAGDAIGEMLSDRYRDHNHYSKVDKQIAINQWIDQVIEDAKNGVFPHSRSAGYYLDYIKEKISNIDKVIKIKRDAEGNIDPSRSKYPAAKVDILHRKVWRIFMTKFIKHLLAYKKPIPWEYEDDYRKEYPEPRKAKIGGITQKIKPVVN
jgi:hypothetical protein